MCDIYVVSKCVCVCVREREREREREHTLIHLILHEYVIYNMLCTMMFFSHPTYTYTHTYTHTYTYIFVYTYIHIHTQRDKAQLLVVDAVQGRVVSRMFAFITKEMVHEQEKR